MAIGAKAFIWRSQQFNYANANQNTRKEDNNLRRCVFVERMKLKELMGEAVLLNCDINLIIHLILYSIPIDRPPGGLRHSFVLVARKRCS